MQDKFKIVAIIPAKGRSERLPNKNILEINGRPMLAWAIRACQESKYNIEPWVSSENDNVLEIAKKYGANVYKRDPKLSEPNVFKQEVIRDAASHILKNSKDAIDVFISLQPNSPQITAKYLDDGLNVLLHSSFGDKVYEVFSVDTNYHQNAAYRMFRSHYVMQRDLSTHCAVVVCDTIDINTKEDYDRVKLIMGKQQTGWNDIKRDTIYGTSNMGGDKIRWYPSQKQFKQEGDIDKFIMDGWHPKSPFIGFNTNMTVFGDCFVQHIIQFLINNKIHVNKDNIKLFFYSTQFTNTLSMREQTEWIVGKREADNIEYFRGNSARGQSKKVVLNESERCASVEQFKFTDVFFLSFGVIEVWLNSNGQSLWGKSLKDSRDETLSILSIENNQNNIDCIIQNLREINPRCKIITQISPIPINATFTDKSVMSANCLAKSNLRSSLDIICQKYKDDENFYYFPSYEIISCLSEYPYAEDNRHLTDKALNILMHYFEKYYIKNNT